MTLLSFAIESHLDCRETFMHVLFRNLAMCGDGKRIFITRRVCKQWKELVDSMDNGHWAAMHACTVTDPVIGRLLLTRSSRMCNVASTHAVMKAEFCRVITGEASSGDMYMLLSLCKQIAIRTACEPTRFATAFDNELRGLAYYAVWKGTNNSALSSNSDKVDDLREWWSVLLADVLVHVEERLAGRSASEKREARDSLFSFVETMAAIAFHACRRSDEFKKEGLQQLQLWRWGIRPGHIAGPGHNA